jgi:hypothetical protein
VRFLFQRFVRSAFERFDVLLDGRRGLLSCIINQLAQARSGSAHANMISR